MPSTEGGNTIEEAFSSGFLRNEMTKGEKYSGLMYG